MFSDHQHFMLWSPPPPSVFVLGGGGSSVPHRRPPWWFWYHEFLFAGGPTVADDLGFHFFNLRVDAHGLRLCVS